WRIMPRSKTLSGESSVAGPLRIEQLEAALRQLGRADIDLDAYWDEHIETFRQTVLLAIRETSEAIMWPSIPLRWRVELEGQLRLLARYLELADRYLELRSLTRERSTQAHPRSRGTIH